MTPENSDAIQMVRLIQAGDSTAREEFLEEYKPFVAKTTMNLCKRVLIWGESDELSIAFIAFNSAIDSYDPEKKVPFLPYAKVVIQNRLKDHFRKQSRLQVECPLESTNEDGKIVNSAEIQSAWQDFRERTIEDERRDELEDYEQLLGEFGIDFESLVEVSPKHRDSRESLIKVAKLIAEDNNLTKTLLNKKQLPINELLLRSGVNRKTLERGRKFIIATALVLHYPMKFLYIRSHINIGV